MSNRHKTQSMIEETMDIEQPNKSFIQVNIYVFLPSLYCKREMSTALRIQPSVNGYYFYVLDSFRGDKLNILIKVLFLSLSILRIKLKQGMG